MEANPAGSSPAGLLHDGHSLRLDERPCGDSVCVHAAGKPGRIEFDAVGSGLLLFIHQYRHRASEYIKYRQADMCA
jgi:hypothetical protein